ncbi:MAG: hypothetical protein IPH43_15025 [Xanthomonadales bacterium]|nr:hypothetical protein [Xanthomonadales bacterium]
MPPQWQRDGGPITTATDVYALGVLLGELVTGERINDGSGRTPSSRITAGSADGGMATVVPITRRQVRGDLDAIILKSLDSDPARRYASAGQLADDIERLLARQPVSAQAPSRWYRARKFVQRHKGRCRQHRGLPAGHPRRAWHGAVAGPGCPRAGANRAQRIDPRQCDPCLHH